MWGELSIEKRKTTTSTAVKRRYNEKHYKKFQADIKIDLFERINSYTEKEKIIFAYVDPEAGKGQETDSYTVDGFTPDVK